MSAAGLSAACFPPSAIAAAQCVTGPLPPFMPTSLTVDCASKQNFQMFRKNSDLVGLAGAVSMSFVRARRGTYSAGNLFLFPWIKPKGQGKIFPAVMPVNATQFVSASPIPNGYLPLDEYFCRFVLQAPWMSFIGFLVDIPFGPSDATRDWFTNVDKLADGGGVGIDWTSPNLNDPWFGGSHWIPNDDTCGGNTWRKLVMAGLDQAAVGAC
jgi:hypothetical protein